VFPFVYQSMSDDVVKILSIALDDSFLVKRDPCEDLCSVFFQCSLSMIQVSALSTLHIYVLRVPFLVPRNIRWFADLFSGVSVN
jgi:hypothetical protein